MPLHSPYPSQAPYDPIPLTHFLERSADRFGDKPALIAADGRTLSFADTWRAARRVARLLQDKGVRRGDMVAIYSPNLIEYPPALYGALLAGATVTTLNPLYREREVEEQLRDSGATLVFAYRPLQSVIDAVRPRLPSLRDVVPIDGLLGCLEAVGEPAPVPVDPYEDLAVLPYSSGTTGLPKGVMLTHHNVASASRQGLATEIVHPESVLLDLLPFYHIYGMIVLLTDAIALGATQVVMSRFDLEEMFRLIQQHRISDLFLVPPAILALALQPEPAARDLSSVRFIVSGAAPLAPELAERVSNMYGFPVMQGYGLTETSSLANVNPLWKIKVASVGPPVADTLERVVDLDSGRDLGPGETGEVLVKGPQVMRGYWHRPEDTAETLLPDGWLRTGDIGYYDEDGYLYLVDRKKEMIKYKGYQIAPAELEAVLHEHPAVADVAVIPKRDVASGEIPKAFVVRMPGADVTADELLTFVQSRVAPYKKVREVEFVDAIPRTLSGKILRRDLIEQERAKQS